MSQWRAFNASGRNQTCLWCGRDLRKEMRMVYDDETKRAYHVEHNGNYGDYGDNSFCGLRSGLPVRGAAGAQLGQKLVRKGD